MPIRCLLLFITALLFGSCSNTPDKKAELSTGAASVAAEAVTDSNGLFLTGLACLSDPSVHYSLYLPQHYTGSDQHPLLLLFDPHGDHRAPLERYRALADRYGFVLMTSVESRNGNDARLSARILEALSSECMRLSRVDTNNLSCGGFSGGARIAAMLAMGTARFKGLVLSGAGFPAANWKGIPPHIVIGYAGQRDMNLSELRQLQPDSRLASRYQFITSQAAHEWPDTVSMEKAIIALICNSRRDGYAQGSDSLFALAQNRYRSFMKEQHNAAEPLFQSYDYLNFLRCFDGLADITNEEKAYRNLLDDRGYQSSLSKEARLLMEEEAKVNEFTAAFMKKPPEWWQKEMSLWMDTSAFAGDKARIAMHCRVQGKLSLIAYSSLNRALQTGMQNESRYFSALYTAIDPGNKEAWFLMAFTFARDGKMGQALESLENALARGFNERTRMETESVFAPLHADNRYQTVTPPKIRTG